MGLNKSNEEIRKQNKERGGKMKRFVIGFLGLGALGAGLIFLIAGCHILNDISLSKSISANVILAIMGALGVGSAAFLGGLFLLDCAFKKTPFLS